MASDSIAALFGLMAGQNQALAVAALLHASNRQREIDLSTNLERLLRSEIGHSPFGLLVLAWGWLDPECEAHADIRGQTEPHAARVARKTIALRKRVTALLAPSSLEDLDAAARLVFRACLDRMPAGLKEFRDLPGAGFPTSEAALVSALKDAVPKKKGRRALSPTLSRVTETTTEVDDPGESLPGVLQVVMQGQGRAALRWDGNRSEPLRRKVILVVRALGERRESERGKKKAFALVSEERLLKAAWPDSPLPDRATAELGRLLTELDAAHASIGLGSLCRGPKPGHSAMLPGEVITVEVVEL